MAAIVVCGGGVIGLCAGLMLAEDGHEVTVLEPDPAGPPGTPAEAWDGWQRRGVAQFRQPHNLFSRFRAVADTELPGLTDRLVAAGCTWVDYLDPLPPSIEDRAPREDDDRIRFVTGRRPVTEAVVAAAAEEHPRLDLRRGVQVTGLVAGPSVLDGVPHVAGVRIATGEEIAADLVVDATAGGRGDRPGSRRSAPAPRGSSPRTAASSTTPGTSPGRSCRGGSADSWPPSGASPSSPCPVTTPPGR
jgi:2-polyprenyl-6-methoxyphenol hydroxylase-like FAD-dependent oxidoreductase